jgi:outer membrane protein assembly factor BamB
LNNRDFIYIAIGNHVLAINPSSGTELWRRKLPSSTLVTLLVRSEAIYAGAAGELFCLDPRSGEIRWQNQLTGLGMGVIIFGDPAPSHVTATNSVATNTAAAALLITGAAGSAAGS